MVPGSHKCGRIEHHKQGGQMEADTDRVQHVQEKMGLMHCEMQPGQLFYVFSLFSNMTSNRVNNELFCTEG